MYESFYGLKEKPFNLLPDPEYLYMSPGHENAFTHLEYAITEHKGFVVVTGEIGSGKTTLINFLLRKIPQNIQVGIFNNTDVNPAQFIKMVCQEFELDPRGLDKAEMLEIFNNFLLEQFALKNRIVLIIDEAQNLPRKTLEEIRMLSNLEEEKHHLIQIILVGQPELRYKLQTKNMEQFVQRVTVHCHLNGLGLEHVKEYVHHRLQVAGGTNLGLFNEEALAAIHKYSRGIPRLINILCDTALVYGFADDIKIIGEDVIRNVVETRQIGGLLSEETEGEGPMPGPDESRPMQAVASDEVKKRLDLLERRMMLLENTILNVEQNFKGWLTKDNDHERLVLELLGLLKDSLISRERLITKYQEVSEQVERAPKNDSHEIDDDPPPKSSFFSKFMKK